MNVCLLCPGFPEVHRGTHPRCRTAPIVEVAAALAAHTQAVADSASAWSPPAHFQYSPGVVAKASAGDPTAVTELRAHVLSVTAAQEAVRSNAEQARAAIAEIAAQKTMCDDEGAVAEAAATLLAAVDGAEQVKVVALDIALVAADTALEGLLAETASVRDALAAALRAPLGPGVIIASCVGDWLPRLTAALARSASLPRPASLLDTTLLVVPAQPPALGLLLTQGAAAAGIQLGHFMRKRDVGSGPAVVFQASFSPEARARPGFDPASAAALLAATLTVDAIVATRPAAAGAAAAAPTQSTTWTCGACTLINANKSTLCAACGGDRPKPPPAPRPTAAVRPPPPPGSSESPSLAADFVPVHGAPSCPAAIDTDAEHGSIIVRVSMPALPSPEAIPLRIIVRAVLYAGGPIPCDALPFGAAPVRGIEPPFTVDSAAGVGWQSPAVSARGIIFAPRGGLLRTMDSHGASEGRDIVMSGLGIQGSSTYTAAYDDESDVLMLAANNVNRECTVVAVDASGDAEPLKRVLWKSHRPGSCSGAGVLHVAGQPTTAVFSSASTGELCMLRVSDGSDLAACRADSPRELATVPEAGVIYASVGAGASHRVEEFRWDGASLTAAGRVAAIADFNNTFPLAAMRPGAAGRWHLVVCRFGTTTTTVLELPGQRVVWEGKLPLAEKRGDAGIQGLAADPSGSALVVCLSHGALEAVAWPWAGLEL